MPSSTAAMREYQRFLEELPRVGPGTPAGNMLRRYWHPVAFSHELRDVPQAVRMLGEDLVLFRDGSGRPGLIGMNCSHRCASLEYGQIRQDGIMCPYHGWRYDTQGHLIDAPLEAPGSPLLKSVRHLWYPVQEWMGVAWTYMGPDKENPPALPRIDVMARHGLDGTLYMSRGDYRNYNYLNWLDNFADHGHVHVLHRHSYSEIPDELKPHCVASLKWDSAPQLYAIETSYGMKHMASWETDDPSLRFVSSWSIAMPMHWRFATYPGAVVDPTIDRREGGGMIRIVDDAHFELFRYFLYREGNWVPPKDRAVEERGLAFVDQNGIRFVPPPDLAMTGQKKPYDSRKYAGYEGNVKTEDLAMQETQGALYDRGRERLGKSDSGVILLRKIWRDAIKATAEGKDPKGVNRKGSGMLEVDTYKGPVRAASFKPTSANLQSSLNGGGLIRSGDGQFVFRRMNVVRTLSK